MQTAQVVHAVSGVIFIALMLSHIYMGTIGTEGSLEAMRDGTVDEQWAKEHGVRHGVGSGQVSRECVLDAGPMSTWSATSKSSPILTTKCTKSTKDRGTS